MDRRKENLPGITPEMLDYASKINSSFYAYEEDNNQSLYPKFQPKDEPAVAQRHTAPIFSSLLEQGASARNIGLVDTRSILMKSVILDRNGPKPPTKFDQEEQFCRVNDEQIKPNDFELEKLNIPTRPTNRASTIFTSSLRRPLGGSMMLAPQEISGWLEMRSSKIVDTWKRVYCKLEGKRFTYRKTEQQKIFSGALNFDIMSISVSAEGSFQNSRIFVLKPLGMDKKFTFRALDNAQMHNWFKAIARAISYSEGGRSNLRKAFEEAKFWKFEHMHVDQLMREIQSGDILLFTMKDFGPNIQRFVTRSKYDHVAMLLKDETKREDEQVIVFEATSSEGVGFTKLKDFITNKWYLLATRMVVRRLYCNRDNKFYERLENFVNNAYGKAYQISAQKLVNTMSIIAKNESFEGRTFFCSELVAAAYKRVGLLPAEISSTQYWPGSFSTERTLPMQMGAYLGPEIRIDFSEAE